MRTVGRHPQASGLLALLLVLAAAAPIQAQDTIPNVIDPNAPPAGQPYRAGAPAELLRAAVARYNDPATTRLYGSFTVGSGTWIRGDIALYRGTLRVAGRITGQVTVLNGSLLVEPSGVVEGDVVVLGGRLQVLPGGRHVGAQQAYPALAPLYRNPTGHLEIRDRAPTLADLARAEAVFQAGRVRTALSLQAGGTYNRVEGLTLRLGPTFSIPTREGDQVRLDLHGLIRTETDPTKRRAPFGFVNRLQYARRGPIPFGLSLDYSRLVEPIEDHPFSPGEIGWSSFLLARDYRDYFEREGPGFSAWVHPVSALRLTVGARYQEENSIPAGDPLSVFRDSEPWRPNPLIDDGRYTLLRLEAELDTRNDRITPTSGWYLRAGIERGRSDDVAPVALPSEVREPLPSFRRYRFTRGWFDARLFRRINPQARVNLRALGAGWVAGDPLPVQRRVSLGGLDLLPGYDFRSQTCAPSAFADPTLPALCDRSLAVQAELRYRFGLGLRDQLGEAEWMLLQRLFRTDHADLVLFGDAGKAWLAGDGPGRVPTDRIPVAREWASDVGVGLDLDGVALYFATPTREFDPVLTVRLQRRF
jgi:hypothetical protein